jgi:O-antigen ligase
LAFLSTLYNPNFRYKLALFSLFCIVAGMFVSRALMSIGMTLILAQFFLQPNYTQTLKHYYQDKVLSILLLILLAYLLSGFYSEDTASFWQRVTIKLPLLFMPLGFAALYQMPKKYFQHLLYFFLLLCFITALTSTGLYIANYELITESYKSAKVIPNIFNISHTRFSLMLVVAVFSSAYLLKEKYSLWHPAERYLLIVSGVFIAGFIHLLSVRSGLLAFYSILFILAASHTLLHKQYLKGLILTLFVLGMPVLAYFIFPTLQNKLSYMAEDVNSFLEGKNVTYYSDGNRLLSIKAGLELGKQHPILGLGIGDVEPAMFSYYEKNHPEIVPDRRLTPHNQFVYIFVGCGLVGLVLFCIAVFYPFMLRNTYYSLVFLALNVTAITSYLSEATLENQLGVCVFITFYLVGWACRLDPKPKHV